MSLRLYLKDGSQTLVTGVTSAKPYPEDDNFIAVIPVADLVAVVAEN